ncbi:MAG: hypothetical protein AAF805_05010 [Planctomycetota bacterium]
MDGILWAVAAIVAVRTLAGLMRRRAERLVTEVQRQVDAHRELQAERRRRERQRQNAA